MRSILVIILLYGLSAPTLAAQAQADASRDSVAIVALELELSSLLQRGAFDEYARHLTADYARTPLSGKLETREEALAAWRALGAGRPMTPTRMWVRVYGDAAVLTALLVGESGTPGHRITKTFIRRNGEWLLAALHFSRQTDTPPRPLLSLTSISPVI